MKGMKCPFEHDPTKKGKGKGQRSRSPAPRENSAERQQAKKKGKIPSGKEEDHPQSFNYKKGSCGNDRACDYWHPPHLQVLQEELLQYGSRLSSRPLTRTGSINGSRIEGQTRRTCV